MPSQIQVSNGRNWLDLYGVLLPAPPEQSNPESR